MRIAIVSVLVFVTFFAGCGSTDSSSVATEGEMFFNTDHGFSLNVPTGWTHKDTLGEKKDGYYFYEEAQHGFVAMQVDVHNGTPKEGVTLASMSDTFLDKYWGTDEYTRVAEGYETIVNNISAYHVVFTNIDATQTTPYNFTNEQWTFTHGDELFRIQTVRRTENADAERTLDAMMQSLNLFFYVE